jgi:hypothetical protein
MNAHSALSALVLWDQTRLVQVMVLVLAMLLPLTAAVSALIVRWSNDAKQRQLAPLLASIAILLTYFHPVVQEVVNSSYLDSKLERARALVGRPVAQLLAELGEPSKIVPDPTPMDGGASSCGYALYGSAAWTPLATIDLIVPLSPDGKRVSGMPHYADWSSLPSHECSDPPPTGTGASQPASGCPSRIDCSGASRPTASRSPS